MSLRRAPTSASTPSLPPSTTEPLSSEALSPAPHIPGQLDEISRGIGGLMDGLRDLFGMDITRLESRYEMITKSIQVYLHDPLHQQLAPLHATLS